MEIKTLEDATYYLLQDVIDTLNSSGEDYIIIGGWSPFLLNNSKEYPHPGLKM